MHPTVKPAALVADAIRDRSRRGDVVIDTFGGSGTTLIAADLAGRKARLVEIDPLDCDTILARWEGLTGQRAVHEGTGMDREGPRGGARRRVGAGCVTTPDGHGTAYSPEPDQHDVDVRRVR